MRSQALARRRPSGRGCGVDRRTFTGAEIGSAERMNTLRLALRMLSRDWHAGELRVLIAALVLAVASVGTVAFFADRVKGSLTLQANLLLGGDLLLSGDRPLPDDYAREARARGLAVVPAIKFNSMVKATTGAAATDAVLADVKAVAA